MKILAATTYDPGTAATASLATLSAMAAIDTTNLRLTFTAPASGQVLVRQRFAITGGASYPYSLHGVLDGSTVRARAAPYGFMPHAGTTYSVGVEHAAVVTGLSVQSYTWDAAWATQTAVASSVMEWGGPNDSSGPDAWGGYVYEIWDATPLLAAISYDPAAAVNKAVTSTNALTAIDTTNARLTFTAPASGNVGWRIRTVYVGATSTYPVVMLGLLESSTVIVRQIPTWGPPYTAFNTTALFCLEASGVVTGIGAGSHNWDVAFQAQIASSSGGGLKYGGPNNASGTNAYGALSAWVWAAS